MTIKSQPWRSGFTFAVVVGVLLGCTGIREDELACEDAVSHLQACCPGFSGSNVDCTFQQGSCTSGTVSPEISISQSACVRSESCAELEATGVCARAKAVPLGQAWSAAEESVSPESFDAGPQPPQVCP